MADANNDITYSLADIQRYLHGSMSAKEMHDLERAALEDTFLADALEGYSEANMQQAEQHVAQIEAAIRLQRTESKVMLLVSRRKYTSWYAAASIVLLACATVVTYFIVSKKDNEVTLAQNKSAYVAPLADSSQTVMQKAAPPVLNTTRPANNKQAPATKHSTLVAENKKKIEQPSQQPAASAAPMAARLKDDKNASQATAEVAVTGYSTKRNQQQSAPDTGVTLPNSTQAATDSDSNIQTQSAGAFAESVPAALGVKRSGNQQHKINANDTLKERSFLMPDIEVINIGKGRKKTADTTATMPEGGWQSFQQYVYARLHKKYDSATISNAYFYGGDLQLEFSISESGEPTDFKVLHTPDAQTATEAINAIKAGPKWISSDKKNKMRIRVKY